MALVLKYFDTIRPCNFKGTNNYKGIYLNDDVTPETRKARDDYRSVAVLARAQEADV